MKVTLFLLSLILSHQVFAGQCINLFAGIHKVPLKQAPHIEYLNQEFSKVDPDTHNLLLDEHIYSGDLVYILLNTPADPHYPKKVNIWGTMLGTIYATNERGHNELFYYVLMEKTNEIISFTKYDIDFEKSRLLQNYWEKTIH